jgi:hypothetical protein
MNLRGDASAFNNVASSSDQTIHDLGVPRRSNNYNAGTIESIDY